MAKQPRTVVLDANFVRQEAAEAVRTFFRPVVGAYNLVLEASNPAPRPPSAPTSNKKRKA
jgi:hypothetical protein